MNIRHYLHIARHGRLYCMGGGGGSSHADTSTATNTATSSVNTDQSMMGGDGAVGFNGSGNVVDKSSTTNTSNSTAFTDMSSVVNNTAFTDGSNHSTNFADSSVRNTSSSTAFTDTSNHSTNFSDSSVRDSSTYFSDSSDRSTSFMDLSSKVSNDSSNKSTNFTDQSDRSVKNVTTTTDFGSVTAAMSGMGQLSSQAINTSGLMTKYGLDAVGAQSKDNLAVLSKAFDFAGAATAADVAKYTDVLGFARDTIDKTSAAYADAKDGGTNKTLTIAAVAVIGAVGLAAAFGRI